MPTLRTAIRSFAALGIIGLVVVVSMLGASATVFPLTSLKADPKLGSAVFQAKCAACHAIDENHPPTYGPSLFEIGKSAGSRRDGMTAEEYIFESITKPDAFRRSGTTGEMSAEIAHGLSRNELISVTAFLCSQGHDPDYRSLVRLVEDWSPPKDRQTRRLKLASLERGRELFFHELKCNICHGVDRMPGDDFLAPDLSKAGLHTRKYLRESIVNPSAHIVKGFEQYSVLHSDGIPYSGRLLPSPKGTTRLIWLDKSSRIVVRQFDDDELEEFSDGKRIQRQKASLMPLFVKRIGPEDIDALLDFLSILR